MVRKLLTVIVTAMPVFAQYAGPAILSRGDAPSAMQGPQLNFRPFVEISGVYDTGLSSVNVNSAGDIANQSSAGVIISGGISGAHSWRHTSIGLTYRGSYEYFAGNSAYNNFNQSLAFDLKHQISRHLSMTASEILGLFNRDAGLLGTISPAVSTDPSQANVPTTDFFDNRTIFSSTSVALTYQTSLRTSFEASASFFTDLHESSALSSVTGFNATGDVQYRASKKATIGASYSYSYYNFSESFSNTDSWGVSATLGYQLSHLWEVSGYAGFLRVESKFIQNVPVDPAIAAIIGITESTVVNYNVRYVPNAAGRLSRTFRNGVLSLYGAHTITPGNGLFQTSAVSNVGTGYVYTGLRRWGFGVGAFHQFAQSIGNVIGTYGGTSISATASRQIFPTIHAVAAFTHCTNTIAAASPSTTRRSPVPPLE